MDSRKIITLLAVILSLSSTALAATKEEAEQAYDDLVNTGTLIVNNITANVGLLRNLTNDFLGQEADALLELISTELDKVQESADQVLSNAPEGVDVTACTDRASSTIKDLKTELARRVAECASESVVIFGYSVDQSFNRIGVKYGDYVSCAYSHVAACEEIADAESSCYDFAIANIGTVLEKLPQELFYLQSHIANVALGIESPCTDLISPAVDVHKNLVIRNLDICARRAVKGKLTPVCPPLP